MFLKNYTSDVPVNQTIERIERVLIKCGVSAIAKLYVGSSGVISAITFSVDTPEGGKFTIRLPADTDAAHRALWLAYADGDQMKDDFKRINTWTATRKKKKYDDFAEQAKRTAWKLVQDWVEVQMSMIQMQQAEWVQVFLPYVWDGKRTVFDVFKESNYKGLLGPSDQEARQ